MASPLTHGLLLRSDLVLSVLRCLLAPSHPRLPRAVALPRQSWGDSKWAASSLGRTTVILDSGFWRIGWISVIADAKSCMSVAFGCWVADGL